jgi:predicted GNAT family acetyltransferase
MEERCMEGYSRNLVIKKDDLVIAHACTNAESEEIAVVAELIVRKEFRKMGLASEIWRDLCSRLLSEKKEVYSVYYSEESRSIHRKIGFYEECEWSKIVIPSNANS